MNSIRQNVLGDQMHDVVAGHGKDLQVAISVVAHRQTAAGFNECSAQARPTAEVAVGRCLPVVPQSRVRPHPKQFDPSVGIDPHRDAAHGAAHVSQPDQAPLVCIQQL